MKKQLLVFTHSGLCNRLLPLVSGLRAAKILGRQLLICWADAPRRTGMEYSGSSGARFNDLFANRIEEITLDEVNRLDKVKWFTDWRGMKPNRWTPEGMELKTPEVIISDVIPLNLEDETIAVRTSRLFGVEGDNPTLEFLENKKVSYLTPPPFVEDIRPYFASLTPSAALSGIIDDYGEIIPGRTIGFHVRKTDLPQYQPSMGENQRMADIIDSAIAERQARKLYLSTDCEKTERWFREYYGDMLITYACSEKFENNVKGTEHAVVDLYSLARSQWIFGTVHSTFSVVSWLLSKASSLEGKWWTPGSKRKSKTLAGKVAGLRKQMARMLRC